MRPFAAYLALALIFAACSAGGSVRGYWKDVDITVTESNYSACEERFAQYAELLVATSSGDASNSLDELFGKIKEDEVAYYIYSEWMESAFHNYLSPCRNPDLFGEAVEHFAADSILPREEVERLWGLAAQDRFNRPGEPCTVPDGAEIAGPALYLVLNLDCRTCLQSLAALAGEHPEAEHIALCFGYSPVPEVSGWKYFKPEGMEDIFELEAAPFWFLTADDGTVRIPYSADFNTPKFANPEE